MNEFFLSQLMVSFYYFMLPVYWLNLHFLLTGNILNCVGRSFRINAFLDEGLKIASKTIDR